MDDDFCRQCSAECPKGIQPAPTGPSEDMWCGQSAGAVGAISSLVRPACS
jgi:hypothetical protein